MVQHGEQRYQLHDNNDESSDEESEGSNEDDESDDEYDDEGGEESEEDDENDEDLESEDDDGDGESGASSDDDSQEPKEHFENEGTTGNVQRLVQRYESGTENSRTIDDEPDDTEDADQEEIHFVPDEDYDDASDSEEEENTEREEEDEDEDEDEELDDEVDDDEEKKLFFDEPQNRDDDEPRDAQSEELLRRKIVIAAIVCCCLVILAVVLGVILATKEDDATDHDPSPTPQPTSKPTPTPVAVTSSPSAAPSSILDEIFFPVIADTYLRGGDFANTTFGTDDVLQVRTIGNSSDEAYILMEFDLSRLPEVNNSFQESQILLQLTHVESLSEEIDSITVIKLPYDASIDVENITWSGFTPANGVVGPSFTVGGDTETVLVDITSLVRGGGGGGVSSLRSGRRLQAARKILLQLESAEGTNLFGEVFRSRESGAETAPLIIHNIITESPSFAPSVSVKPSFVPSKSTGPTLSSTPTTSRPPSASPSNSAAPSTSMTSTNNTVAPTSINVSETFAPTRVGTMSNNNSLSPGSAVPSLAPSRL